MQISNVSVASLFQELQSLASGAFTGASFGDQLTGQKLPTSQSATSSSSLAAAPLSATPSSQFASNILSTLLSAQEGQPSPQTMAGGIISAINPNGTGSLSLSQVEQALTGGSATTSPQQLAIAGAFSQLDTNGDGSLSQTELASGLQSLQQSDPFQALGGHHHHHHHHVEDQSSADSSASTSSTASVSSDPLALAQPAATPTAGA